jgi:hypothetical protein
VFVSATREHIKELLEKGHRQSEIARILNLARPTVGYHVSRLRAEPAPLSPSPAPVEPEFSPSTADMRVRTGDAVRRHLEAGLRAPAEISGGIRRAAGRVWRHPLATTVLVVHEGERVAPGASRRRRNRQ